jgi:hypothetical protein
MMVMKLSVRVWTLVAAVGLAAGCLFVGGREEGGGGGGETGVDVAGPSDVVGEMDGSGGMDTEETGDSEVSDAGEGEGVDCAPLTESGEAAAYEVCGTGVDDNCDGEDARKGDTIEIEGGQVACGAVGTPCERDNDCRSGYCVSGPVVEGGRAAPEGLSVCGARMFTTSQEFFGNMKTLESAVGYQKPDEACAQVVQGLEDASYGPVEAVIDDGEQNPFEDAAPEIRKGLPVYTSKGGYQTVDVVVPVVRPDRREGETNVLTKNPVRDFPFGSAEDLQFPLDHDESGELVQEGATVINVWTGWNKNRCSGENTSALWSSGLSESEGGTGDATIKTASSRDAGNGWRSSSNVGCYFSYRLYCVEQE